MAASGAEGALRILEGRWKLVIIFHLFARGILRFSDLERAIPAISQKMLIQQLRDLERDGVVRRTVYPQVPPKVEYELTEWGKAMCPALDALLEWAALRPERSRHGTSAGDAPRPDRPEGAPAAQGGSQPELIVGQKNTMLGPYDRPSIGRSPC
jgi:DNA-binding HxlR family transcriptional regulator